MAIQIIYSDVDNNFAMIPSTGDVARKINVDAINQSIITLVLTRNGEVPMHYEIGTQVSNMLFENASPILVAKLKASITNVINNYEPRVSLNYVDITDDSANHRYYVTINYNIVNTITSNTMNFFLNRVR